MDNNDQLAREEVFGPVLAVIPFDSDDDAVRIANDSNYGLGGSVYSSDEERALGPEAINNYLEYKSIYVGANRL